MVFWTSGDGASGVCAVSITQFKPIDNFRYSIIGIFTRDSQISIHRKDEIECIHACMRVSAHHIARGYLSSPNDGGTHT